MLARRVLAVEHCPLPSSLLLPSSYMCACAIVGSFPPFLCHQVVLVQRTRSGGTVIDEASILLQELNVEADVDFVKCLATNGM